MIYFRADGNQQIGTGHIMRCLSLADALRKHGKDSTFIVSGEQMTDLISSRGYSCISLRNDPRDKDNEVGMVLEFLDDCEMFILDSYYAAPSYVEWICGNFKKAYIDDLVSSPLPVEILIDYNIYASESAYQDLYSNSGVKLPELILGISHVPLRDEFRMIPPLEINDRCSDVLISTGGSDPLHFALQMMKSILKDSDTDRRTYHFLIGSMNSDKEQLELLAKEKDNIKIHSNVSDMKSLIRSCDIAVSASGSTLYEICACGVPLITYTLADNQLAGANAFADQGLASYCGDIRDNADDVIKNILDSIKRLDGDKIYRQNLSRKMQELVDGCGADRIAKRLIDLL
ncbi:MAG: UDP-2,4-diacetamido-2,4,6-trideoxy-beta-L-altropyranose hydrolase [Clostridiales bacterium]|nr:UDP-2,4-diacetamido-2,4,6-trideoxy-beta-L-altropyranose hydrolase [Clostridiales bacterium]